MMNKFLKAVLHPALLLLATALVAPVYAADTGATSNMEILRQKVSADKRLVVASNMDLTEAEAKAFWPVYDAYQQDLHKINERIVVLINSYALAYNMGAVLNDTAKQLIHEAVAIELAEAKLKQSYLPKLGKVLPSVKVARYIQIETKIRALVRYSLAESIPLVE